MQVLLLFKISLALFVAIVVVVDVEVVVQSSTGSEELAKGQ
jgi:hypothetical protein